MSSPDGDGSVPNVIFTDDAGPENFSGSRSMSSKPPVSSHDEDLQRSQRAPALVHFEPTEDDLHEHQRALDVDSAMQISRSQITSTASKAPFRAEPTDTSPAPLQYPRSRESFIDFPAVSTEAGQRDENLFENQYPHITLGDGLEDIHGNENGEEGDQDELDHSRMLLSDDPFNAIASSFDVSGFGQLPTYQDDVGRPSGLLGGAYTRSNFDFETIEAFANEERQRLEAARSPGLPQLASSVVSPASSEIPNIPVSQGEATGGERFVHRRQRRLSQSTPTFRRQAKSATVLAMEAASEPDPYNHPNGAPLLEDDIPSGAGPSRGHDRPYRFSFYSNAFPTVIHARGLSELPAEGQSFEDLFNGRVPEVSGNCGAEPCGASDLPRNTSSRSALSDMASKPKDSLLAKVTISNASNRSRDASVVPSPIGTKPGTLNELPVPTPQDENHTWWLDVLSPTDEEMQMLAKAFHIHPLTTEDILMEEIELFRTYYLVCFRSFDQDPFSPTHLEPLNMYVIVFREGVLSFHFRGTPHPTNVRRRIKQMKDYINVTSDWISYALIDDITDAFGPLIQSIEFEVDSIDELVLILKQAEQSDMLRRIGTCRKKVMGLLRLMGNKADVVKGLSKRSNEQWSVAPKSDIGLYLSDIQDHLITMTQNLNHYEKILSRSHSNYLAQISIDMTDANNQINNVLSKLTALGTVLIPMNLITGLWGMNVHVPGQDVKEGYTWFLSIIGGLLAFALTGAFFAYKLLVKRS